MTSTLIISPIDRNDIEALVNLVNSAYRGESSKMGWTTEADLLDGQRTNLQSIQNILQQPGAILLTAKDETRRLLGCVYLHQQAKVLYLGMLTVAPDIQGKGIGNQLLLAAEKYAQKNNCNTIRLTVIDVRQELIDWYKRKDYQSTGEIQPFPSDPKFGLPKQPLQFMVLEKNIHDCA